MISSWLQSILKVEQIGFTETKCAVWEGGVTNGTNFSLSYWEVFPVPEMRQIKSEGGLARKAGSDWAEFEMSSLMWVENNE